jgi:hypothetical protein
MSNHLAIATVTAALGRRLKETITQDIGGGADVTFGRPKKQNDNGDVQDGVVNLFLYQVSPNPELRNDDLPTRAADGRLTLRPQVALDLHYILSFYGDESRLLPERMLGSVVRSLHAEPVLTRSVIERTRTDGDYDFVANADLDSAVETVRFVPESLSLEELSKLWSVFFEIPYALSVAYKASVVLITPDEAPRDVLPVTSRLLSVQPSVAALVTPPSSLPALQLWLKSDAGLTFDSNGVSRWEDESGRGHHAEQANQNRRPALIGHAIGQRPALRFNGVDHDLALSGPSYDAAGSITALTVCALVRSSADDPQIIISFDGDEYWHLSIKDAADGNIGWATRGAVAPADRLRSPDAHNDGRWRLICATFEAGSAPDKRLFVDGTEVASILAHNGGGLGSGATRFGYIGVGSSADASGGNVQAGTRFNGEIAELVLCHHALGDEERRGLDRYFMQRYRQ